MNEEVFMAKSEDQLWDELYDAQDLDDSVSKTSILEDLLGFAEAKNLDAVAFSIRLEIIQSTIFSGDINKALVAFTHCVAEFDAEKEYALSESFSLLWSSKWINRTVIAFPNISKKQIDDIENDIARRFDRHGFGLRAHYMFGWLNAKEMGDEEKADQKRKRWIRENIHPSHPRCVACEYHYEMLYQMESAEVEKGLHTYRSLLSSREVCNRVPLASHILALPHLNAEKDASKAAFHFASFGLEPANIDRVSLAADFLFYLLSVNDGPKALEIVTAYLGHAFKTKELDQKLSFLVAAECFLNTYDTCRFPWAHLDEVYDAKTLKAVLKNEINELAEAFDARNENRFVSSDITEKRARFSVE